MKKIIFISICILTLALVSCKKKGVCTCTEGAAKVKVYYDDMTGGEKRYLKRSCNGEKAQGYVAKTETTFSNGTTVVTTGSVNAVRTNCEWSRTGKE